MGDVLDRDAMLAKLVDIQYERNDTDPSRGKFRVRGDSVEVWPSYEEFAYRHRVLGRRDRAAVDHQSRRRGEVIDKLEQMYIYPAKHFVLPEERIHNAVDEIRKELRERLELFKSQGKLLEAQRLNARTRYDVEMMMEMGYCPGIENYSRPLSGRKPGEPPYTLFDFFPKDYLLFVDESHATVPQVGAMYAGDRSRKETLVEHGFRLPSALDNRPLQVRRVARADQPGRFTCRRRRGQYELEQTGGEVVEQVVRPTGLLGSGDRSRVRPAGRCRICSEQIRERAAAGERVLVTTLTKRLAEDLADYFTDEGVLCKWLHSELDAFERVELLRDLRQGQVRGAGGREPAPRRARPARSVAGGDSRRRQGRLPAERDVADANDRPGGAERERQGDSVRRQGDRLDAADDRRNGPPADSCRKNTTSEHGITPETIKKAIYAGIESEAAAHAEANAKVGRTDETQYITEEYIAELEAEMFAAAEAMEFERAAAIRDRIEQMREQIGKPVTVVSEKRRRRQETSRQEKNGRSGGLERTRAAAETKCVTLDSRSLIVDSGSL